MANTFWREHPKPGRDVKFATDADLYDACLRYFEWNEANPLNDFKLVSYMGRSKLHKTPKMRAMSVQGMCAHIGISRRQFRAWRDEGLRPDLVDVIDWAEDVIRQQKFEAAAADLMNANLISRDLQLRDGVEHTGVNGGSIKTEDTSPRDKFVNELARVTARIRPAEVSEQSD